MSRGVWINLAVCLYLGASAGNPALAATPSQAPVWHCATEDELGTPRLLEFEIAGSQLNELTSSKLLQKFLGPGPLRAFTYQILKNDDASIVATLVGTNRGLYVDTVYIDKGTGAFSEAVVDTSKPPATLHTSSGDCELD